MSESLCVAERAGLSSAGAVTVRTYVDPVRAMAQAPVAAAAMAANLRRRYKGAFQYFSMGKRRTQESLLACLDGYSSAGGVAPWQEVPEPWEREATADGTWAAEADKVEMAGGDGTAVARAVEGLHAFDHSDAADKPVRHPRWIPRVPRQVEAATVAAGVEPTSAPSPTWQIDAAAVSTDAPGGVPGAAAVAGRVRALDGKLDQVLAELVRA